jgi:hypothetical protein
MNINGVENLTVQDLQDEVAAGGKFVIYSYCFSIIVMSFKRGTDIYFVKSTENRFVKSLPWFFLSFFFGWWGLPWGIIYTIGCLGNCIGGGKDVTADVMNFIHAQTNGPVFDFEKEVTDKEAKELDVLKKGLEN